MWLFSTSGFISAISHRPGMLTVRARDSKSLDSLAFSLNKAISHTPNSDYPYRIELTQQEFSRWVLNQVLSIAYSNFKNEIFKTRGYKFAKPLNEVWSVMHQVEDESARSH